MNFYKFTIQYKGTNYFGFQIQNEGRTIQGELNKALCIMTKSDDVKTIGSGRTDSGVHALGQIIKAELPIEIPTIGLLKGLNSHLPDDIRVLKVEKTDESFHPIFSANSKEYNYIFTTDEMKSAFTQDLVTHFQTSLDIEAMRQAAKEFVGEYDFINYQCVGTEVSSTIRNITKCEILECSATDHWRHFGQTYYVLKIEGNGFLKQMVRLIMGALVSVGKHKITTSEIRESLNKPLKNRLGPTAPPQGLYLVEVHY